MPLTQESLGGKMGPVAVAAGRLPARRSLSTVSPALRAFFSRAAARATCLLLSSAILSSAAMSADVPRDALEFFRGDWTILSHESTYAESCDWLPGRAFLACHAEDRSEVKASFSMSVFGYSEADGLYTYTGFSSAGFQRSMRGDFREGVWRFHGQSERAPSWRRWQVTMTPTPQGFHFREEVSDRSGPWKAVAEFSYVRKSKTAR